VGFYASFGNRDLLSYIHKNIKDMQKAKRIGHKVVKEMLFDRYFTVLTKLKINKDVVDARKEWLL
jgi:hypothetical protein